MCIHAELLITPLWPLWVGESRKRLRSPAPLESDCSEGRSPNSKKPRRLLNKAVGFANQLEHVLPASPHMQSPERSWYSKSDYGRFKGNMKSDVCTFMGIACVQLSVVDKSKHCVRGLEKYLGVGRYQEAKQTKRQRIAAVLDQQMLQRVTGVAHVELLRVVAEVLSQPACDKALERAMADASVWLQDHADAAALV